MDSLMVSLRLDSIYDSCWHSCEQFSMQSYTVWLQMLITQVRQVQASRSYRFDLVSYQILQRDWNRFELFRARVFSQIVLQLTYAEYSCRIFWCIVCFRSFISCYWFLIIVWFFKFTAFYKNGSISYFMLTAILFACYDLDAKILSNIMKVSLRGSFPTNSLEMEFANLSRFLLLNISQSHKSLRTRQNQSMTLFF